MMKRKKEASYRRQDKLENPTKLMQQWQTDIDMVSAKGNVLPIGVKAAP